MAKVVTPQQNNVPMSFLGVTMSSPFDYDAARAYVGTIQFSSFMVSVLYMVVIFGIKFAMQTRKPYQLKLTLQLWNLWLALFSILGSLVTGYGLLVEIQKYGIVSTYTHSKDFFQGVTGLWTFWFCMSKLAELGDTILIVLRKKPLIFLHWYHHVATLNYGLMSYIDKTAFNTWIVWLNFSVHAVMYSYYFLAACSIRLPAWFSQCLTTSQITQFLITLVILAHVGIKMLLGHQVDTTPTSYIYCLLMEISYVMLFGNFFYQSYIAGGGKKFKREKALKQQNGTTNGTTEGHQNGGLKSE
jgi:elongation of very long chain fatty acids protein 6